MLASQQTRRRVCPPRPFAEGLEDPTPTPKTTPSLILYKPTGPISSVPPATPVPADPGQRRGTPTAGDHAWYLGFTLGRAGVAAAPLAGQPPAVRAAFLDGLAWGQQQRDADSEEEFHRHLDRLETAEEGGGW